MAAAHRAGPLLGGAEEEAWSRRGRRQGRTRPGLPHYGKKRLMPGSHDEEVHRETGEPPSPAPVASTPGSGAAIAARITALDALTTADLQIEWRRLYRATPPTRLSRDLLIRGVGYELQEQVHGGLS